MPLGEGLGADGLLGAHVVLDDGAQHLEPAFTEHRAHLQKPSARYLPCPPGTLRTRVPDFPAQCTAGGYAPGKAGPRAVAPDGVVTDSVPS
ncbi:hypothetical protein GCM10010415_03210 [Streptomyces atrovirens]